MTAEAAALFIVAGVVLVISVGLWSVAAAGVVVAALLTLVGLGQLEVPDR